MFNIYLIIDALVVLALVLLSALTLSYGGYKRRINRLFVVFTALVAVWIPATHISNDVLLSPQVSLYADYIVFPSSFAAMLILMMFVGLLVNSQPISRIIKSILAPLWIMCVVSATPLVVAGVEKQDSVYAVIFGPLITVYASMLFIMIGITFYALYRGLRHTSGAQSNQLQVVNLSLLISIPLIVTFSFILPSITGIFAFTEFGVSPMVVLVIGLYYSVIKHQLFDVRLTVVRSVAYAGVLITLAVVYYLLAYIVSITLFHGEMSSSVSMSPINTLLALLLALIFQPIKHFFDQVTNNIFYRDNYRSDEFFARLSRVLTSTTDLRTLMERAATEIGITLKAEQAFLFVYHMEDHHISAGTKAHTGLPVQDARQLDTYADQHDNEIVVAELMPEHHVIRRLLESHKIAVLLPLTRTDQVIGYLALGEQRSRGYTNKDLRVLAAISDELVIAIQNSLSVQEVRDINVHLQQRIDAATQQLRASNTQLRHLDTTKDEFLSMASHQLRTPLTSVKGYISMVLEGDAGKITEMQKHLLSEAFISSERMVHLIHDFLNVSRLQTGKFMLEQHPFDLAKLAKDEVNNLQHTAESRKMKLKFVNTTKLPLLNIDENKIRQVVMNFIDNALFYSHEDATITIELTEKNGAVELRVKDTGIGVPKNEQDQLFSKFYRASNARKQRPDGTGVGLFLAKKVIVAHGGDVLFESLENKGSTFGFSLPLEKLSVKSDENAHQLRDKPDNDNNNS